MYASETLSAVDIILSVLADQGVDTLLGYSGRVARPRWALCVSWLRFAYLFSFYGGVCGNLWLTRI
ncbi:hypothetical protein SAMN05446635_5680 [Burkholderia sp. OK233]|nr:hypothetical protein SAMN05446635_5680 [Burkholderia sp. OK233]